MKKLQFLVILSLIVVVQVFSQPAENPNQFEPWFLKNRTRTPNLKINGGKEATPHRFPQQAALTFDGSYSCSGTLISKKLILTTANCISGAKEVEVKLGYHSLNEAADSNHFTVTSRDFKVHPDYKYYKNDIGFIILPEEVPLQSNMNIGTLYDGSNDYVGDKATLSGWGATSNNGDTVSNLRYLENVMINTVECSKKFIGVDVDEKQMCMSGVGPDNTKVGSCDGDQGGPLTINTVQVGIASFSCQSCTAGCPIVFTRISKYKEWILETCTDCKFSGANDIRVESLVFVLLISFVLLKICR